MDIAAINPATGKPVRTYRETTGEEAAAAIDAAHEAWRSWRRTSFAERAPLMKKAGAILRRRKGELAGLMATEMGKPLKQGIAESEKCAWVCDYFAENAQRLLEPES